MKVTRFICISAVAISMVACKKENKDTVLQDDQTIDYITPSEDNVEETSTVDVANAPVLHLGQDAYDFGDVKAGETVEKTITFTNEGKSPLIIKQAKATCGCTVPEYSNTPVGIGEEGSLVVKYTAPAFNGKQTKTVTLITNTANQKEEFLIQANIVGGKEREKRQPAVPVTPPNL